MSGEMIWVWCPYCHKGETCVQYSPKKIECPTTGKTFTDDQSCEDIRRNGR